MVPRVEDVATLEIIQEELINIREEAATAEGIGAGKEAQTATERLAKHNKHKHPATPHHIPPRTLILPMRASVRLFP